MFTPALLPPLKGKVFIVTGGNTGIGYSTVFNLDLKGAKVYLGARSSKAESTIAKTKETFHNADIRPLIMDNNSISTVVTAAKTFITQEKSLNGLILNAGIMACPYSVTLDGFESQMQVNYIAHWVLAHQLILIFLSTSLEQGPSSARVIAISSEGHQKSSFGVTKILYDEKEIKKHGDFGRYGLRKLANVMHGTTLHSQYGPGSEGAKQGKGAFWTASLHPGFINTQLNELNRG